MNGQPHTHEVRIGRKYQISNDGPVVVRYGDTTVSAGSWWARTAIDRCPNPPSDRAMRRAIRRAIRRHDKGTMKAATRSLRPPRYENLLAETEARLARGGWGIDALASKEGLTP